MRRIFYCLALVAVAHVNLAAQSKPARPAGHCPAVTIEHPDDMVWPGTPVTLTAKVSGGGRGAPPTFFWTVSSGEVINGQGTSTLTIDTTSMSFSDITVTVEVGGLAEECDRAASCVVHIGGCGLIRKFDEFADLDFEDEKPRLDNFAIQLSLEPNAKGQLIIFSGRQSEAGYAQARGERALKYLTEKRGLPAERLVFTDGGQREDPTVELYITPPEIVLPSPKETLSEPERRP